MKIKITTYADCIELASRLRKSDITEIWSSHHLEPLEALLLGLEYSNEIYSVFFDNKLVLIFGITLDNNIYCPWMLASNDINEHPVTFYRQSKKIIKDIIQGYEYLENYVDANNTDSIKWLKWLGFTIDKPVPFGLEQKLFHRFFMGGV